MHVIDEFVEAEKSDEAEAAMHGMMSDLAAPHLGAPEGWSRKDQLTFAASVAVATAVAAAIVLL
jgi:hypothetical protein